MKVASACSAVLPHQRLSVAQVMGELSSNVAGFADEFAGMSVAQAESASGLEAANALRLAGEQRSAGVLGLMGGITAGAVVGALAGPLAGGVVASLGAVYGGVRLWQARLSGAEGREREAWAARLDAAAERVSASLVAHPEPGKVVDQRYFASGVFVKPESVHNAADGKVLSRRVTLQLPSGPVDVSEDCARGEVTLRGPQGERRFDGWIRLPGAEATLDLERATDAPCEGFYLNAFSQAVDARGNSEMVATGSTGEWGPLRDYFRVHGDVTDLHRGLKEKDLAVTRSFAPEGAIGNDIYESSYSNAHLRFPTQTYFPGDAVHWDNGSVAQGGQWLEYAEVATPFVPATWLGTPGNSPTGSVASSWVNAYESFASPLLSDGEVGSVHRVALRGEQLALAQVHLDFAGGGRAVYRPADGVTVVSNGRGEELRLTASLDEPDPHASGGRRTLLRGGGVEQQLTPGRLDFVSPFEDGWVRVQQAPGEEPRATLVLGSNPFEGASLDSVPASAVAGGGAFLVSVDGKQCSVRPLVDLEFLTSMLPVS